MTSLGRVAESKTQIRNIDCSFTNKEATINRRFLSLYVWCIKNMYKQTIKIKSLLTKLPFTRTSEIHQEEFSDRHYRKHTENWMRHNTSIS